MVTTFCGSPVISTAREHASPGRVEGQVDPVRGELADRSASPSPYVVGMTPSERR